MDKDSQQAVYNYIEKYASIEVLSRGIILKINGNGQELKGVCLIIENCM